MMEIAAAMSLASTAFSALKKGMETGREIEDMVDYFGKWFEAKDALSEQNINANNQPMFKKMFSGNSVEAQALQVTHAKHKIKQMEKELYEYLLYTGQQEFYNEAKKFLVGRCKVMKENQLVHMKEDKTSVLNLFRLYMTKFITSEMISLEKNVI